MSGAFCGARAQVEWEFWTNSNDECGSVCDTQQRFISAFKASGKQLQIKVGRGRGRFERTCVGRTAGSHAAWWPGQGRLPLA
jgi:hypothetical protein